ASDRCVNVPALATPGHMAIIRRVATMFAVHSRWDPSRSGSAGLLTLKQMSSTLDRSAADTARPVGHVYQHRSPKLGSSKRWGPRRWDLFVRAAALIAVPLAVIGLEVPAQAATLTHHAQAGVTAGAAAPSSVPAERVCAAPKPGDYSCF